MELVREALEEDPQLSIRRTSNILEIPRASIHRILRCDLGEKKNSYHIQVFHNLQDEDYPRRAAMCAELIDQIESGNLINKILFSDEATFHTCRKVSQHNCCIWADETPPFLEWERDMLKVNVWLGLPHSKVYGPFFFAETTVTGPVYLDMFEQFLKHQLLTDGILETVVFYFFLAPCHYAIIVHDYLDRRFPGRWIGREGIQPRAACSPDLTPLDFFAWGFIESTVYTGRRIGDSAELRNQIIDAVQKITPRNAGKCVLGNNLSLELCRDTDGHHMETNK
jgi:hypothetical protein